ncbi:hypothetical protein DPMN_188750 [Dreissena polymorpha]|uniref:Uncharacterized protein n=1 Tax=Dreissena polymorpha TaxID=45954 RepID=A0A9D4IA79_DREPO|nr:hypothetical protein DPMN_188750 [Dreissena polymorpha]
MVNRLYLRTPRKKIIEQAQLCHRKRHDFLTAISKGLVPPETPPGLRKKRRRYSMDVDDVSIFCGLEFTHSWENQLWVWIII